MNTEIIVEFLLLYSSRFFSLASWVCVLLRFSVFLVIRIHCVYDTYSLMFCKMDVNMNWAGFSFFFLSR